MIYYERNLPHWLPPGKQLFVTWRLYGSLPAVTLEALRKDVESSQGKKFLRFDRQLGTEGFGPTWLRQPEIARIVSAAIGEVSHNGLCAVHAYVVMPNHVHLLLEPKVELKEITRAIKGCSARDCNKALNRMGLRFWQEESFDHWVRSATSFERIRIYIESNPVSPGLVKAPKAWQWSSAFK